MLRGAALQSIVSHPADNSFVKFGFLAIFHVSFFIFITTIGLNIIFGIIVDTFSELRDLKVGSARSASLCLPSTLAVVNSAAA